MSAMRRVTVLLGGASAEREVSLSSGGEVIKALRAVGHEVTPLDPGHDVMALVSGLREQRPDVVFNALHGRFGEDGAIQGVLEWMGLPYTHSGIRASSTAMDKAASRALFIAAGLPMANGKTVTIAELAEADPLPAPYVVKPLDEGSSVGVSIVREGSNRRAEIASAWRYGPLALVESYIAGREITVGVLDDGENEPQALTVTDILPNVATGHDFYDYDAKYGDGGSRHVLPAAIHPDIFRRACEIAIAAHKVLGCAGASRSDFRYDDTDCGPDEPGRLALLEVNTQPGMTPTSLLPEQAAFCGISYEELCDRLVREAERRAERSRR
ncbi:D-alanine--D-alanine ligase [Acetobacter nitrogenifigens DSM 23921 = NBRC 105050]|uniref:D-alanine--D-alanine ligase n=1 Tax=Acetobacter nitrogenifigens DSM 23921 = NBRC 105050 TaxID=1120919 RepID=A0A511X854_9PROT|nr:D-alanine--D-alanine ligase [Acetobacter nitrogenifigens]GBQ89270.1 D-alanine--D-alanine ligase [Acetobacter nitrogenifigens DSM 23921 = NBRC 105050]GEN59105.1 D-alanine--D-alanine ligase [Acetobacter nitrogenifigens DSM 23921 = NBRC 105050]